MLTLNNHTQQSYFFYNIMAYVKKSSCIYGVCQEDIAGIASLMYWLLTGLLVIWSETIISCSILALKQATAIIVPINLKMSLRKKIYYKFTALWLGLDNGHKCSIILMKIPSVWWLVNMSSTSQIPQSNVHSSNFHCITFLMMKWNKRWEIKHTCYCSVSNVSLL